MTDFILETNAAVPDIEWKHEPFTEQPWSLATTLKTYRYQGKGWRFHGVILPDALHTLAEDSNWFMIVYGHPYASAHWQPDRMGPTPSGRLQASQLLALWIDHGAACTQRIAGDYALIILEKNTLQIQLLGGMQLLRFVYYHAAGYTVQVTTSLYEAARLADTAPKPDPATLIETAIFGHSLGEKTLWKGYSSLLPGEHVQLSYTNFFRKFWINMSDNFHNIKSLNLDQSIEAGALALSNCVASMSKDIQKMRIPLFLGFDSRLILSMMSQGKTSLNGITLGGADILDQTQVAKIASSVSLPLTEVPLDDEFVNYFPDFGLHVIKLVDGFYSFERSFNPYMMYKTRDLSNFVITGSIGGDLLQPFRKIGTMVTELGFKILTAHSPVDTMNSLFSEIVAECPWIREEIFNSYFDEALSSYWDLLGALSNVFEPHVRFYYFILKDSIRKWYGSQIMSERTFGIHLTPFWDDEFVRVALQCPFTPITSTTSGPSVGNTMKAFQFYSKLIEKYNSALLGETTKYGFAPADLLSPMGRQKVRMQHVFKKWSVSSHKPGLPYEKWDREFLWKMLPRLELNDELFNVNIVDDFEEGSWKADRLHYARTVSQAMTLALWNNGLKDPWL